MTVKGNIPRKTAISDSDCSENTSITKNKISKGRKWRKIRTIMSSESEELDVEQVPEIKQKKCSSVVGVKNRHSKTQKSKIQDTDSFEEISEEKLNEVVRPSISEVKVGDYVIIEFIVNQSKKNYVGVVVNIGRDVLQVIFILKKRTKFLSQKVIDETTILPTQILKILSQPLKKQGGELVFQKSEIRGIVFV